MDTGLFFDRDMNFFHYSLRQTLEPRAYYTYVPFRDQNNLPVFDTTVNTLTYDQLFTYNRFSSIDRINDANQVALGLTTRFIDQQSGYEKIRIGVGQIFYFEDREVTLCNSASECADYPGSPDDTRNRSPLSGVLQYNLTPHWTATANTIWNSDTREVDNQTFTLNYARDTKHTAALAYTYVRNGDTQADEPVGSSANNLSQTDFSALWPLSRDWSSIVRWTENWNRQRFQNLYYGLQYDSCCWAVRFVAGRAFTSVTLNNTYQYDTQFYIQFALKGLGSIGTGGNIDPEGNIIAGSLASTLNSGVTAYQPEFGQDF
jgi:LPS-assembly protein